MRFNGTGRTKVYHIFINIMREGALARERGPGKTRQSKTRSSRKGLVSPVALASAPLRKNNVCAAAMHAAFVEKLFRNCYIIFHESHSGTTVSRVAAPVFSRHSRVNFRTVVRTRMRFHKKKKQRRKKYVSRALVASQNLARHISMRHIFLNNPIFLFLGFAAIRI